MNAKTYHAEIKDLKRTSPVDSGALRCIGFQALKSWQVERYRQAVNENRWYMSQKCNRCVGWQEAERDFCNQGYYGCAEEWRQQYCGKICANRDNCLMAVQFSAGTEEAASSKTG